MSSPSLDLQQERLHAARRALEMVEDGMVLGLGTGSTSAVFLRLLGERVREGLRVRGVPTSGGSDEVARGEGIPVVSLEEEPALDLAIDGADEVDGQLRLIKGGGGALIRERVVASAARRFVVIVDSRKRVETLGRFPLPVEVVPFALPVVRRRLEAMGCAPEQRQRGEGPYITDNGNPILDCRLGRIDDPESLARALDVMPGVVGHGLFLNMASVVLVGTPTGVVELAGGAGR